MPKQTSIIIFAFCVLKLTLHLVADSHSGFQGDELLHIETGKHLAWGYMEFPPLMGILAFVQNLFGSTAVYVHHLFSHAAAILIMIFAAKTTILLGGKNKALILVLLAIIIAPSFGRSQQLFQPVVFSQLCWVVGFYALARFVKYLDRKSLWYLTASCTLGFLVKYDAVFFIFGLSALLLFQRTRTALIQHRFWINILVFLLCITPNLVWQVVHDYPALQMFDRLHEMHLSKADRLDNLISVLIGANPLVTILLIATGILYLFLSKDRPQTAPLTVFIALAFSFLLFKNGKSYYFYPFVLLLLPFGALFWEQMVFAKRKWVCYPVMLLLLPGAALIPFGMPVYDFDDYLKYVYPFEKKEIEGGRYGVKYDEYYTKEKWTETMQLLKTVYDSLPPQEKKRCMIWGKHYGQAGAVNLLGSAYSLPKAFSYHGSFYTWAPAGDMPPSVIALSYRVGDFFDPYFEEVRLVRTIYNPYADTEEELYQRIYVCKRPRQDFTQMKELFKHRIFE